VASASLTVTDDSDCGALACATSKSIAGVSCVALCKLARSFIGEADRLLAMGRPIPGLGREIA